MFNFRNKSNIGGINLIKKPVIIKEIKNKITYIFIDGWAMSLKEVSKETIRSKSTKRVHLKDGPSNFLNSKASWDRIIHIVEMLWGESNKHSYMEWGLGVVKSWE